MNNPTQFLGENLLPGNLGHAAVLLSFVASLLAFISYFQSTQKDDASWKSIGRAAFWTHGLSVIGIVCVLFYIIYAHLYEYHYAWAHSSKALPVYYIISSFWEGQEGSFLLWTFWNMVIGFVLMYSTKKWESPVMAILSLVQLMLSSMLIGLYFFEYKLGSSPFILLRDALQAPIFSRPDYLQYIQDGNGLNPLLQNLWMVIHPPVLFLGFASAVVPFAFVCAGLWKRDYHGWTTVAMPWSLFSVMILGTGIIMGGMWAYESLTFGGYWAWDPVENASLIPWLILIAGVHTLLVYRKTGRALLSSFLLLGFGFLLILYATFLTRSGILGNASVHSFTDLGMSGQLLAFLFLFIGIFSFLLISRRKEIPKIASEEHLFSREFWLFIGSLLLALSSFQVFLTTSIPVYNKITGSNLAPPANVMEHYNRWQLPIAILILLFFTFSQYLKFKQTEASGFLKSLLPSLVVSTLVSGILLWYFKLEYWQFHTLLVASVIGIVGNTEIVIRRIKKIKNAGAAIAHVGFAFMMLGVLISSAKKEVVSINKSGMQFGDKFDDKANHENILLWKNEAVEMQGYRVTYLGDSTFAPNTYYRVLYEKTDKSGKVTESFVLRPNAQINPKMGLIASPDTRHFLHEDLYTHVSQVPDPEAAKETEGYKEPVPYSLSVEKPDTLMLGSQLILFDGLSAQIPAEKRKLIEGSTVSVSGKFRLKGVDDKSFELHPVFAIRANSVLSFEDENAEAGVKIRINGLDPKNGKVEISVTEKKAAPRPYIIMKALVFPYINLLWGGTVILIIGFSLSIMHRYRDAKREEARIA